MIKTELRDCQIDIYAFIKDKKFFGVFGDYGIGKTLPTLRYIDKHNIHKVLVVGKKKNVEKGGSWSVQIDTHTDFAIPVILTDMNKREREFELANIAYPDLLSIIYLINYDGIPNCINSLIAAKFDMIIFDESTEVKSAKSKRWRLCAKLIKNINIRAVLCGSPITENYFNLWPQIYLLDMGEALETTAWKYYQKYFYKFIFGWNTKKNSEQKIVNAIKSFCISKTQDECMKLPPRKRNYYSLLPTATQTKYFRSLTEEFAYTPKSGPEYETQHIFAVQMKLRQVCSGFIYENDKNNPIIFRTPKDELLLELIEGLKLEDGCIVWCQFDYEIRKISGLLLEYNPMTIYKGFSTMEELRVQKPRIIISTPSILGAGETILRKYSIRYSHEWSFEKTSNSRHRNYRRGSEIFDKVIEIDMTIRDSIEETMLENRGRKTDMVKQFRTYLTENYKPKNKEK